MPAVQFKPVPSCSFGGKIVGLHCNPANMAILRLTLIPHRHAEFCVLLCNSSIVINKSPTEIVLSSNIIVIIAD